MTIDLEYPATPYSCCPETDVSVVKVFAFRFTMEARTKIRQSQSTYATIMLICLLEKDLTTRALMSRRPSRAKWWLGIQTWCPGTASFLCWKATHFYQQLQVTKDFSPFLQLEEKSGCLYFLPRRTGRTAERQVHAWRWQLQVPSAGVLQPRPVLQAPSGGEWWGAPNRVRGNASFDVGVYETLLNCVKEAMIQRFGNMGHSQARQKLIFFLER